MLIMKKLGIASMAIVLLLMSGLFVPGTVRAQDDKQEKTIGDSKEAKQKFLSGDPSMANLFKNAYGYVIFPNIGKGAAGVGAAAGHGTVYEKGKVIGTAHMTQLTVGAQAGGAAYREVIFFENKDALNRFTDNKVEFSAETAAIAVKAGASANANYRNGVVVFSQERGGLLLDASLGGQKFKFKSL
jgi:lipid-binding SYLF domain-containing protein